MNYRDDDYRVADPDTTHRWIAHCRAQLGIKSELAPPPIIDLETGEIEEPAF